MKYDCEECLHEGCRGTIPRFINLSKQNKNMELNTYAEYECETCSYRGETPCPWHHSLKQNTNKTMKHECTCDVPLDQGSLPCPVHCPMLRQNTNMELPKTTEEWLDLSADEQRKAINELWSYIDTVVPFFVYEVIRKNIISEMMSNRYDPEISEPAKHLARALDYAAKTFLTSK